MRRQRLKSVAVFFQLSRGTGCPQSASNIYNTINVLERKQLTPARLFHNKSYCQQGHKAGLVCTLQLHANRFAFKCASTHDHERLHAADGHVACPVSWSQYDAGEERMQRTATGGNHIALLQLYLDILGIK
jgi:hypothetical protein